MIRAPVVIKPGNDPITDDVLREISGDLGDEWQKLAHALNVKKVRLQAIMKKNIADEKDDDTKYDMLITWAKKVPRGMNKVSWSLLTDYSSEVSLESITIGFITRFNNSLKI